MNQRFVSSIEGKQSDYRSIERVSESEREAVIALYLEEQLGKSVASPKVDDIAEGLGIPEEEVTRLLREVRRRKDEEAQRERMAKLAHAQEAELEAQIAEANVRRVAAETRTKRMLAETAEEKAERIMRQARQRHLPTSPFAWGIGFLLCVAMIYVMFATLMGSLSWK